MNKVWRNKTAIFLFMLPTAILFIGILIAPIFMSFKYSLTDWNGYTDAKFVGFDNYVTLLTDESKYFMLSLKNVMILAVLSVCLQLPISFWLANTLARGVKFEKLFVGIFFAPVLISGVVVGQLWLKVYHPVHGLLNQVLTAVGLENWTHGWLGDKGTALAAVFVPILWQYVGYHMLLMYAGIKAISPDVREAAMIDGAKESQVTRYITLPLLKPVIKVCVIFAVVGSMKAFDLIYSLTGGDPQHATEVPSTLLVEYIFLRNNYGFGSTIAVSIIVICFALAMLIQFIFRKDNTN